MFVGGCLCLFTAKQLKMEIFWICSPILAMCFWMSSVQLKAGKLTAAWHLLGTATEWLIIPPWCANTVMYSLWCGGRDFPSPSHHPSWDVAGYVVRKCSDNHIFITHMTPPRSSWRYRGRKDEKVFCKYIPILYKYFQSMLLPLCRCIWSHPNHKVEGPRCSPGQAREGARGWWLVLPLVLGGKKICPMEKPRACIQDSSIAGSTGKGPGQGDQGWKIAS